MIFTDFKSRLRNFHYTPSSNSNEGCSFSLVFLVSLSLFYVNINSDLYNLERGAHRKIADCDNHNRCTISLQRSGEKLHQAFIRVLNNLEIFHANEEKSIRKLKKKFNEEKKRVCQTIGWRDYNHYNLSAFYGDLGPVEVEMHQIIQEQHEKKEKKTK